MLQTLKTSGVVNLRFAASRQKLMLAMCLRLSRMKITRNFFLPFVVMMKVRRRGSQENFSPSRIVSLARNAPPHLRIPNLLLHHRHLSSTFHNFSLLKPKRLRTLLRVVLRCSVRSNVHVRIIFLSLSSTSRPQESTSDSCF